MAIIFFIVTGIWANKIAIPRTLRAFPRRNISETNFNVSDINYSLIFTFCLLQFSIGSIITDEFSLGIFFSLHLIWLRFHQFFVRTNLLKFYIALLHFILKFIFPTIYFFETNFPRLLSSMHHPLFFHLLILTFFLIVPPIQEV